MESEKWNLYHISSEDISVDQNLKYWTLTSSYNGSEEEILGVITRVYSDRSIDYLGKKLHIGTLIDS